MGTTISPPKGGVGLADALFTRTQQGVLGLLFGQPDRSFFATEIIGLVGAGSGAVQRELARLEQSGLVTVTRVGTQKHFQADPSSPLFHELSGIARKTFGLATPLRSALEPLARRIRAAFVFGSIAKRTDSALSDIDLLVLSDVIGYADMFPVLERASKVLGRTVNPTILTPREWKERLRQKRSFAVRVAAQPKIWIIGSERDLQT
jgi:predicted nucleotidyltransferase